MKKEKFLELFSKEVEKDAQKLYNYFETANKYEINICTEEFYTPNFWKELGEKIGSIKIKTHGLTDISERRQILFISDESQNLEFSYKILEIKNLSKFKEQEHKDYLGSILGLNIKRELLGDIMVLEDKAYTIVSDKISDYLISNLDQIGKSPCEVKIVDNILEIPSTEFKEVVIRVSSERLDSIVSELINISRTSVVSGIESGNIMLNYAIQKRKDKYISISDVITIRKHGKYIFSEDLGIANPELANELQQDKLNKRWVDAQGGIDYLVSGKNRETEL